MYTIVGADGQSYGPVDDQGLWSWCQQGRVVAATLVTNLTTGQTTQAGHLPQLRGAFGVLTNTYSGAALTAPVQNFSANPYAAFGPQPKSKKNAILLAIILGFLGAHRFYLGHTRTGMMMLLLLVIGLAGFSTAYYILFFWSTIDFFLLVGNALPDSRGVAPQ